jgi:hypothetical protein
MAMTEVARLVVLAGPSAVGKTHLVRQMRRGEPPALAEQLGLQPPFVVSSARDLKRLSQSAIETLVVHYDFLDQRQGLAKFQHLDGWFEHSSTIDIITMHVPCDVLADRMAHRVVRSRNRWRREPSWALIRRIFRQAKKCRFYRQDARVSALYEEWYTFLSQRDISSKWELQSGSIECTRTAV